MKKLFLFLSHFFAIAYMGFAQDALPETDIYICDVSMEKGKYYFKNLTNITKRKGYDNQPSFIDNNTILYTSIREDKQADIYKYDLKTGKITQITNTSEDEYSPTLMPDGKYISTVRVEEDSTQRLWKFPLANPDSFSLVFPDVKDVGYHAWVNDTLASLFLLTKPFSVYIKSTYPGNYKKVDNDIGRTLQKINDSTFAYESVNDSNHKGIWTATLNNRLNFSWFEKQYKIFLPKDVNDFVFGPDSAFWVVKGVELMRYKPDEDKKWKVVSILKGVPGINFYRMAFSPDGKKLALVSYMGKKP